MTFSSTASGTVAGHGPGAGRSGGGSHWRLPVAGLVLAAAYAGGAAVLVMWWSHTPNVPVDAASWLIATGRITGLLAGYTVALLLMLMSRLPLLERRVGADRLARWHAAAGRYAVSLAAVHALAILEGYALTDRNGPVGEYGALLSQFAGIGKATAGWLLLVSIGVVSARAVRRRVSYETWYAIHLFTYVAVGLTFWHQIYSGADFVGHPVARWAWSALYLAAALLLAWFRFGVPLRAAARHRMRVLAVRQESPGTVSIYVAGQRLHELGAEAGQFLRWRFMSGRLMWQSHPFSLSEAPPGPGRPHQHLRITVKGLGDYSRQLWALRPGTPVFAEGPYGALTADRRRRRRVLLLAGGVGITPLRALFETLPAGAGELTLLYRVNNPNEVLFRAELDAIAARRGATVRYLAGVPGGDNDPFVGSRLARLVPHLTHHDVFLCGPPRFMEVAEDALRRCGVSPRHVHAERFAFEEV